MGTRADFYVGRGEVAEWLGSIAFDGYFDGIPVDIREATDASVFRVKIGEFFAGRDDATLPSDGWPWPWDDSATTDYAYAFDGGTVWASCFGSNWELAAGEEPETWGKGMAVFPDMKSRKNVTFGRRSGLIVLGGPKDDSEG